MVQVEVEAGGKLERAAGPFQDAPLAPAAIGQLLRDHQLSIEAHATKETQHAKLSLGLLAASPHRTLASAHGFGEDPDPAADLVLGDVAESEYEGR
ncbi:hypothetical protein Rhe02_07370 [Rhizocola hellebori]|uniref:Uncharacterized protein n=1 Tax=Rhizocola hellebori TaxID=1392758 RepID=A0A8J3Q2L7_9ACTN|nr:hypothetical protein Rhe02_07370 [Rhizocola hellebori]